MTRYFVDGIAGNNANNGSTPALAKATLTGGEALALVGGDIVTCRGGFTYRETLTTAHAGSVGNPILFEVDLAGLWFPTGGIARITGSDNDQTAVRASNIVCNHNYRMFRGFYLDSVTSQCVQLNSSTNSIIEDCIFMHYATGVSSTGVSQASNIIRRCVFTSTQVTGIAFTHTVTVDNTAHLVENCLFFGMANAHGIQVVRVGGVSVRNCTFWGCVRGCTVTTAVSAGQTATFNNCIFTGCQTALFGAVLGDITEDYNNFFKNGADRNTVNIGAHSLAYTPLLAGPLLGLGVPGWIFGNLTPDSLLGSIVGNNVASEDAYKTPRANPSSWGAVQQVAGQRPYDAGGSRSAN